MPGSTKSCRVKGLTREQRYLKSLFLFIMGDLSWDNSNLMSMYPRNSSIWNIITFYKEYGSVQTLSGHPSWSHYCEFLSISDKDKRHFYEMECINAKWSVRELRRQISSSLFERLLLSNGDANKHKVLDLVLKGNVDMQYALGGLNNNIFASKYVTYMPDKEQLIAQVEAVLTANSKEHK